MLQRANLKKDEHNVVFAERVPSALDLPTQPFDCRSYRLNAILLVLDERLPALWVVGYLLQIVIGYMASLLFLDCGLREFS